MATDPAPAPAVEHQPKMHRVGATDKRLSYQARCTCGWESGWEPSANGADAVLALHMDDQRRPL